MSNATRWYTTRDAVKAACGIKGADLDPLVDSYIASASEDIEHVLGRRFIPETATKTFRWPRVRGRSGYTGYAGYVLYLDDVDLLAATTIQSRAQDAVPVSIPLGNVFLEPANIGPPYTRVEISLASNSIFESGQTPQRSIAIAGRWGWSETTKTAGALAAAMSDTTGTVADVTDASLISVGDTLLIGTEALFVSSRSLLDTTATLQGGGLTATQTQTSVTIDSGAKVKQGEVIQIDSERMLVIAIAGNVLTVNRAVEATVLAAHSAAAVVYALRRLTVTRGENGTTAATHLIAAAISKYAAPGDVEDYCKAEAIAHYEQGRSGWTGQIGGSEQGAVETRMFNLGAMRSSLSRNYSRLVL